MPDINLTPKELSFVIEAVDSHISKLEDDHHHSDIRQMVNIRTGLVDKTTYHYRRAQELKLEIKRAKLVKQRIESMQAAA